MKDYSWIPYGIVKFLDDLVVEMRFPILLLNSKTNLGFELYDRGIWPWNRVDTRLASTFSRDLRRNLKNHQLASSLSPSIIEK
jgi:hypothetical protein